MSVPKLAVPIGPYERSIDRMRQWTDTTSCSATPTFVVVSGYDRVPAQRFETAGGQRLTVSNGTTGTTEQTAVQWFRPGTMLRERLRCHQADCRRWMPPLTPQPADLGWVGFCPTCVAQYARTCVDLYGRLPDVTREFFCPYCLTMRQHPGDRCTPEVDGRIRIKCWPCRHVDVARAYERAAERHGRVRRSVPEPSRA